MLGHTAAWKVNTLSDAAYKTLKSFVGSSARLDGTIARHQLQAAVRAASQATGRTLRLVRRDIVDASSEHTSVLPIVASVDKRYRLSQNLFIGRHAQSFAALAAAYRAEQQTVHSTVVAEIVKRYVRRSLGAFPVRDHGGVYFVSAKREDALFALKDFLAGKDMGQITHIRVMGDAHETRLLTEEICRLTKRQIAELRAAFDEADLNSEAGRSRLRKKVSALREDLTEMRDLFGFARSALDEKDAEARQLMKQALRGAQALPADALSEVLGGSAQFAGLFA